MPSRTIRLRACFDPDAEVFCVIGETYPGITFEAATLTEALERGNIIVPDLMEANGEDPADIEIVLTEGRLDVLTE